MRLLTNDLRDIERAIREPRDAPLVLKGYATAELPAAADFAGGWVYDLTVSSVKWSDGTNWKAPASLSGAAFTGDVSTIGNIVGSGLIASTVPGNTATGTGIEIAASIHRLLAFNRGTSAYEDLMIAALSVHLQCSGTDVTVISSTGQATSGAISATGGIASSSATAGIGYAANAGGSVTQATSRTTAVTLDKVSGAITLVSAAGSVTPTSFTVTNSTVAATDVIIVNQKSGADKYEIFVTAVAAGSFQITFFTTGGTTTEQPVFTFAIIKAVNA